MKRAFIRLYVGLLLTGTSLLPAEERVVFSALPTTRYTTSIDESKRIQLTAELAASNAVKIVKVGDDYFWKTRFNRKVYYSYPGSGAVHYFVDPLSCGFVKIIQIGDKITYIENVSTLDTVITYFGTAKTFTP